MEQTALPSKTKQKKMGSSTIVFPSKPQCASVASVVGPFEGKGPLGSLFDKVADDDLLGKKSWEQAEQQFLQDACKLAAAKAGYRMDEIELVISGDLLNQIVSSSFASRQLDRPYLGVFSACASWGEALLLAASLVECGMFDRIMASVCSHHETAERQYRFPIEFGNQRPMTAQWTVTGAGAAVIETGQGRAPCITHATIGRVVDMGGKNPYDMGSAMAPAAADTLLRHFQDTDRSPADYDLILTGDLSRVGHPICRELMAKHGYDMGDHFEDCGILVFDNEKQDVHAGGSGAACCAITFASHVYPKLKKGELSRVLLVPTGALHSTTTFKQGESIPCIAHAIVWEAAE